jgi:phosphate transport system permease protein
VATTIDLRPAGDEPVIAPTIDVRHATMGRGRRIRNKVASVLMALAFLTAVIPLGFVMVNVTQQGMKVMSFSLLTNEIPPDTSASDLSSSALSKYGGTVAKGGQQKVKLGIGPAIAGTLLTILGASLMAIPLGILGAVYLNEYGKQRRFARFIRFMTDVMTGVPSVVMGVFIYSIWVVHYGVAGKSAFAASLALACLMLPIVVRSTEEMLRLVPDNLREASSALGARTWKTTLTVVLPAATAGIVSGAMLAVARAAGETAPVLFTIGAIYGYNWSFSGGNTSLSQFIYNQASLTGQTSIQLAWAAALTLITIVVVLTLLARAVSTRITTLR